MPEPIPLVDAELILNGAVTEAPDTATGTVVMAAYVEFYQRMATITGQRAVAPSYLAHE